MIQYIKCLNNIKLALKQKKFFTYIEVNKKNKKVLDLLIKYNIIIGFSLIHSKKNLLYKVYLNISIPFYNLKNLLKISKPKILKLKGMNKLQNKNTQTIYILNTSEGFLNIREAIQKKQGGTLLFRIF